MTDPVIIDGRRGEGGGQVLRTSLSLAAALGRPLRIENVRAGRPKPGLMRQHLTAVRAVQAITDGDVRGAELGSQSVELHPGSVRGGEYSFSVGSAGSATLVLQTILVPLALADAPSTLRIEGGTHNPWAPPFEFLTRSFLPLIAAIGARAEARLVRPGFHPAGGGVIEVEIEPAVDPRPLHLLTRGDASEPSAEIIVAHLREQVAQKEAASLCERLGWPAERIRVSDLGDRSRGPGNAIHVVLPFRHVTEVVSAFGRRGLPAPRVATDAARQAQAYLSSDVPVGEHLADQLLLPMVLLGGGTFRTSALSSHTRTNLATIEEFVPDRISLEEGAAEVLVRVVGGLA